MRSVVITTIQPPTGSVLAMLDKAVAAGFGLLAIGDRKTPQAVWPEGARYIGVREQLEGEFESAHLIPLDHYARKNVGYLAAIAQGASVIFDTDDDNAPLEFWRARTLATPARTYRESGWVNVYQWFSDAQIWPRGLPLDWVRTRHAPAELGTSVEVLAPIQQGLVDGSPDVDAVWRLVSGQHVSFRSAESIYLSEGAWCPFNSQSTWWFPVAYPLMYLPSFVSFRMTDIWRSFVAQRCLWALGQGVVFHAADMHQERNAHQLMRDFEDEVPGYLNNDKIRGILERTILSHAPDAAVDNCHRCYDGLVSAGLVPPVEIAVLEAWFRDLQRAEKNVARPHVRRVPQ